MDFVLRITTLEFHGKKKMGEIFSKGVLSEEKEFQGDNSIGFHWK